MKKVIYFLFLGVIYVGCTEEQKELDFNTRSINDTIPDNSNFYPEIDEEWVNELSFEGELISL